MSDRAEKAFDYDKVVADFGDAADMMISQYESMTFDLKMQTLLEGMIEKDWAKAMVAAHTMKGSSGYIHAQLFLEACKHFQEHVKADCLKIENPYDPNNNDVNKPQYEVKDTFDDNKKLIAYELFAPLMKEAVALKIAMSQVTKSVVAPDLYKKETLQIQAIATELKRSLKRDALSHQQLSMKSQHSRNNVSSQLENQLVIDQPQTDAKCCKGCNIF